MRIPMADLERIVIEKTDFLPTHVRTILRECERKGEVVVEAEPGYRRSAGTYRSDKVFIKFPAKDVGLFDPPQTAFGRIARRSSVGCGGPSPGIGNSRMRTSGGHSDQ